MRRWKATGHGEKYISGMSNFVKTIQTKSIKSNEVKEFISTFMGLKENGTEENVIEVLTEEALSSASLIEEFGGYHKIFNKIEKQVINICDSVISASTHAKATREMA